MGQAEELVLAAELAHRAHAVAGRGAAQDSASGLHERRQVGRPQRGPQPLTALDAHATVIIDMSELPKEITYEQIRPKGYISEFK